MKNPEPVSDPVDCFVFSRAVRKDISPHPRAENIAADLRGDPVRSRDWRMMFGPAGTRKLGTSEEIGRIRVGNGESVMRSKMAGSSFRSS